MYIENGKSYSRVANEIKTIPDNYWLQQFIWAAVITSKFIKLIIIKPNGGEMPKCIKEVKLVLKLLHFQ